MPYILRTIFAKNWLVERIEKQLSRMQFSRPVFAQKLHCFTVERYCLFRFFDVD